MKITSDFLNRILKSQPGQEDFLPKFKQHISKNVISLGGNHVAFALRLEGTQFEGVNDSTIVSQYLHLNKALSMFGKDKGSRLGLWCTLHHKKVDFSRRYEFSTKFTREFHEKYMERFQRDDYYENIYYITAVLKYEDIDDVSMVT